MPTIIRNKIFEINSSSTHSITFTKGSFKGGAVSQINLNMADYEFGWGQDTYTDTNSLLAYILIYLRDWCEDRDDLDLGLHNLKEVLSEATTDSNPVIYYYRDDNGNYVDVRLDSYFEQFLNIPEGSTRWNHPLFEGYIDHQSVEGNQLHYIIHDKEALLSFLFGDGEVETDNDNH